MVENIVGKGENAGYQHFLLFSQSFQKPSCSRLKVGIVWGRGNSLLNVLISAWSRKKAFTDDKGIVAEMVEYVANRVEYNVEKAFFPWFMDFSFVQ